MKQRLAGQKALVTGANSGIGEAVAKALAADGAAVVVNYVRGSEEAERVASEIRAGGGEALALEADVSDEGQVVELFRRAVEVLGTLDILVNNAGIQRDAPFHEMTLADWNRVLAVNLTGAFLCSREAAREFLRRGVRPEASCAAGKVLFISSVHEVIPWAGHANYAASKGGLSMLMKTMAQELAPHRIRVNGISPGAVRTGINRTAWETPEAEQALLRLIPYGRLGEPADIGRVAAWLASDEADYVTGASVIVDGGMTLYPSFRTGG
ncbi:MAG: glucose 1-dehydrogenase [Deltaproteobacteria bacterium]|nr:glucose 1-dehydrogenase [Deltaproteobacteria bacterium]